jgi:hypothetical protein
MKNLKVILLIAVFALASLSCGVTFDVPVTTDVKTGPTVTEEILIPIPDIPATDPVQLSIAFGAGEIYLNPGTENGLVEGTATYNIEDFRPEIQTSDSAVELSNGNLEIEGWPKLDDRVENTWDLLLANRPMDLKISAGAYQGRYEFGGLSLASLKIADGASDVEVNFDQPNQAEMHTFRYETGASNVVLTNLGNANFRVLNFRGGAGNYELDFSGEMQEDATVIVETGLSSLKIVVPGGLDVLVDIEGGLSNVTTRGDWDLDGGRYTHAGEGPTLNFTIKMGAGNVELVED